MAIESDISHVHGGQRRSRRGDGLGALANVQHGVVTYPQLIALGYTGRQVEGMAQAGWLHRLHRGVYVVGRRSVSTEGRWLGAVLACGPGALLSHRCAGALHGIHRKKPATVDVTVVQHRRDRSDVRIYRSRLIEPPDRTVVAGIPCASMPLTLLQLAAVCSRREVERACDEAEVQRLFDLAAIEELLARSAGRRGAGRLRAVLDEHAIGTTLTRPDLEERALVLCREVRLAAPVVNETVHCGRGVWWEVDFLWCAERVVLEADGHRFHRTRRAVERDRRKEADLVIAGYRVLRCTWLQVEREPARVADMLRVALSS